MGESRDPSDLNEEELREIAREVGIDPQEVQRAVGGANAPTLAPPAPTRDRIRIAAPYAAVLDRPGLRFEHGCWLGYFSFHKLVIYQDLIRNAACAASSISTMPSLACAMRGG